MKKIILAVICALLFYGGCKKEKPFTEPDVIIRKWTRAIQDFDYEDYASCEAFPKSPPVFREMYRNTYFTDCMVTEIGKLNKKDIEKDHEGNPYLHRDVFFECAQVNRKTGKPAGILRGEVKFIRYTEGPRADEGWLMWNRTLVRIKR